MFQRVVGVLVTVALFTNCIIPAIAEYSTISDNQLPPGVFKCCPMDELYDEGSCVSSDNPSLHPFELPFAHDWPSLEIYTHANFTIKTGQPICPFEVYYLDPNVDSSEKYYLLLNGSLYKNAGVLYDPEDYCFDVIKSENVIRPVLCFSSDKEDESDEKIYRIYPVGMLISVPFLFLTFLVYATIRHLRNLHGCCLMSHVASLLIGYSSLATLQMASNIMGNTACKIVGFSVQYFFLATFFWLNVMCLDIYWAFSSVRSRGRPGGGDRRKLLLYSLYAWGMPLIILGITIVIDVTDLVPSTSPFKPKVGVNKCFFDDRESSYTYFYGPMALILCVNMVLFGITAYRIWRTSKETASLNRGDSRRHSDKQENERFKLYLKLFLVMGINWVAELVSFIFGEKVPHYLWYVSDITNTLQGVFIFIIFVWKRRVRRLVWDRVCMLTGHKRISRSRGGTSSDATTTTTTSINNTAVSQLRLNSVSLVK